MKIVLTSFTIDNMQYLEELKKYIKKKRLETGLSLNKFSIEAEIESSSLSKFENNKRMLSMPYFIKIAKAFDKTLAEFLTEFEKDLKNKNKNV